MKENVFEDRLKNYKKYYEKAKFYFDENFERINALFNDTKIRDFVFEPFKEVFYIPEKSTRENAYKIITQVAIVNAVLAGLPGQMGVGVYVSMAMEAWMAYALARYAGIRLKKPSDVFKYFGLLSGVGATVMFGFKHLISFGFSLFSFVPMLNPLILAELFVTDIVGILFLVGFEEYARGGGFKISSLYRISSLVKGLFKFQYEFIRKNFTLENIKLVAKRMKAWFNGDLALDAKRINGEVFASVAMAYLLSRRYEKLQGPLGEVFLEAIRLRWSKQLPQNASVSDMAELFSRYDEESLKGALSVIKGKMFEIMVANAENEDNDEWVAKMHEDESYPGSDIIFTDTESGRSLEVSLKALDEKSSFVIEDALKKYPDIPILATEEAAELYKDNPMVFDSHIKNDYLVSITEENLDEILKYAESVGATEVAAGGVASKSIYSLWPFVSAYIRKKISYNSLEKAFIKILGENGISLASKTAYAALFGPVFAWYLLARSLNLTVRNLAETSSYKIEIKPKN